MAGAVALGGCARGSVQDVLGMGKRAPDEFAVVKSAPLIVPPDYDLRPPDPGAPRPNVGRTSDQARLAMTASGQPPSEASQVLSTAPSTANSPLTASSNGVSQSVGAAAVADDLLSAGTRAPSNDAVVATTPAATTATAPPAVASQGESRGELVMVALAGGDQADPDIRREIAEENQALADVEASLFTRVVKWREPATMGATIDAPAEAQRLRNNKVAGRAATDGDTPTIVNRRQSALQGFLGDIF
jgi:hypothetical protein